MEKKITPEELQQLNSFKAQFSNITFALGENQLRKQMLLNSYNSLKVQEQEFIDVLTIKYGEGAIDSITGIISHE